MKLVTETKVVAEKKITQSVDPELMHAAVGKSSKIIYAIFRTAGNAEMWIDQVGVLGVSHEVIDVLVGSDGVHPVSKGGQ